MPISTPSINDANSGCSIALTNLNYDECQSEISGVNTIYMVTRTQVSKQDFVQATEDEERAYIVRRQTPGSFITATDSLFSVYCTRDLGELKYTPQGDTLGSRSFKATLEVHHPSFRQRALAYFGHIINREWIIFVRLNNGEYHMLGDIYRGAIASTSSEATSGKAASDQHGVILIFEWDVEMPRILGQGTVTENIVTNASLLTDPETTDLCDVDENGGGGGEDPNTNEGTVHDDDDPGEMG